MTAQPPGETEVAIIGGGVVGLSAALALADRGVPCVVLEKGRAGAEQSSRNWGWVRTQGRDPREIPLMLESARLWDRIAQRADGDIGYGPRGTTYLARTEGELAPRLAWLERARPFGVDARPLSAAEIGALLGRPDHGFIGALHSPGDRTAEPTLATPALARLAAAAGARVVEGCAARGLRIEAGRVAGVATEAGEVRCRAAILAGGVWSRGLLANHGVALPQLGVVSTAIRTTAAPMIHPGGLGATPASLRRRPDGGYTIGRVGSAEMRLSPPAFAHLRAFLPVLRSQWRIVKVRAGADFFGPVGRSRWALDRPSPMERMRVLDPAPDRRLAAELLASAQALHPALAGAAVAGVWAGMIDVTPDEIPVIGPAGPEGLVVATGMSGHGFGLGPGAGLLAAQLATGEAPVVDPAPYALTRFG